STTRWRWRGCCTRRARSTAASRRAIPPPSLAPWPRRRSKEPILKQQRFRQAAIDHLAVAERLDTAWQVVRPATALVILAAVASISAAVVWSIAGRVPTRVYGQGLLLREGSIVDVSSLADGQVQHMMVKVGDLVKEN